MEEMIQKKIKIMVNPYFWSSYDKYCQGKYGKNAKEYIKNILTDELLNFSSRQVTKDMIEDLEDMKKDLEKLQEIVNKNKK